MPRNSSGVYTLPAGNPVVTDTLISSVWANATMDDVGSEMTNSLDRSGRGGMLAALEGVDGTESVPMFTFTLEPSTGMWRGGAGELAFSVLASKIMKLVAGGMVVPDGYLSIIGAETSSGVLRLQDVGVAGVNVHMTGDGVATPSKYLRVTAGAFQVVSDDYARALFSVADDGTLSNFEGFNLGFKKLYGASVTTGAFAASDSGKCVYMSGSVICPNAVMASTDVVYFRNTTGAALGIAQASGLTLRLSGTTGTGSRTIAPYGFAWAHYTTGSLAFLQGDVA